MNEPPTHASPSAPAPRSRSGALVITPGREVPLSRAQTDFNKLLKRLESARAKLAATRARLDTYLSEAITGLMPLIETENRANLDVLRATLDAAATLKLTRRRRQWLDDLCSGKAHDLVQDSVGLTAREVAELEELIEQLGTCEEVRMMDEEARVEFEITRAMMENAARQAGVNLDLGGLDPSGDPIEFERLLEERLAAARLAFDPDQMPAPQPGRRKPTKAQLAKEQQRQEADAVKKRDLKTLFKQLAKVLHPDLETDPVAKLHKDAWMKRLTTAYAAGDLHDMLQIEMEWLGEEEGNLAKAGDDKLKIYCMVLKEQIADLKDQTQSLFLEPQYGPLRRFTDPHTGELAPARLVRESLTRMIAGLHEMLEILATDTPARRKLIHQMADDHARSRERLCGYY